MKDNSLPIVPKPSDLVIGLSRKIQRELALGSLHQLHVSQLPDPIEIEIIIHRYLNDNQLNLVQKHHV